MLSASGKRCYLPSLFDSFHEISGMLQNHAPKTEAVLMALDDGSRAVLVSTSRVVAGAFNAACRVSATVRPRAYREACPCCFSR